MTKNKRVEAVNWFRGLAILFVVLSHLPLQDIMTSNYGTYFALIIKNGTFFFVFISGYLFWHLESRYEVRDYLMKKLKNVVSPYCFILGSALMTYGILTAFLGPFSSEVVKFSSPFEVNGFIWHLLVGGGFVDALWFIPMILLFFIASPIIILLSRSKYLVLFLAIFLFYSITSFRPENSIYPIYMFFHFLGVFFLGIYAKSIEGFLVTNSLKVAFFSGALWLITLPLNYANLDPGFYSYFYKNGDFGINYFQLTKVFATFFFLSVLMIFEQKKMKLPTLDYLANLSFGIFFIHGPIIWSLSKLTNLLDLNIYNPILNFILMFAACMLFSLAIVHAIKVITGKNSRYFIGC